MAGQSAIWQVQQSAANGTEATATSTNTVLFNETPVVTAGGHIFSGDYNIRRSNPENTKVASDGNEVQDMGIDGIEIQLTGIIKDSDSGNGSIDKLMTWQRQDQTTTGYTLGRFGLRLDDFPAFNIVPTSQFGGIINSLRFVRDPSKDNKTGFVMIIRLGGDFTSWFLSNGF